jgi:hypothetical protein
MLRRKAIVVLVALVVVVSFVVGVWAYVVTAQCTPSTGEEQLAGQCPPPRLNLPTSTTFIANGTVFAIPPGKYVEFQFELVGGNQAALMGSFTTNHSATVYVMDPGEFANFSAPNATEFSCSWMDYPRCFTTGVVPAGKVNISALPVVRDPSNGVSVEPWFLVMQNGNTSVATNVTWTHGLVATYLYSITIVPGPINHATRTSIS